MICRRTGSWFWMSILPQQHRCPLLRSENAENTVLKRPSRWTPPLGPPPQSLRQRTLNAWRGVNEEDLAKAVGMRAKATADVLTGVLKSIRIDRRQSEAEIVNVWNVSLDPAITAHAQPTGLAKGTLFVTVDSSVWLSEIVRYRRKEILERLQLSFGKTLISRISFRTG